ncbi:hypothetical protein LTR12_003483 [Friedmanniomyces endolithicus]|nr:hypothetical protein LTR74_004298 [Friedmanniomyces endolithicus]KAK1822137.1 hypothetical protein LTR12_003483 [Friedmanniomyces endolithicus]
MINPALLLVSSQIRREALPLFYDSPTTTPLLEANGEAVTSFQAVMKDSPLEFPIRLETVSFILRCGTAETDARDGPASSGPRAHGHLLHHYFIIQVHKPKGGTWQLKLHHGTRSDFWAQDMQPRTVEGTGSQLGQGTWPTTWSQMSSFQIWRIDPRSMCPVRTDLKVLTVKIMQLLRRWDTKGCGETAMQDLGQMVCAVAEAAERLRVVQEREVLRETYEWERERRRQLYLSSY